MLRKSVCTYTIDVAAPLPETTLSLSAHVWKPGGSIQTLEFTLFTESMGLVSLLNVTDAIQNLEKYKRALLNFPINIYGYEKFQY